MPRSYLVSWRLADDGDAVVREALTPIGTVVDRGGRYDLIDLLPYIEVVAKRSYHKIQSEMDDPITMENEFHKFVHANKTEQGKYGARLIGFFPVLSTALRVTRSQTEDRIAKIEAYLVYEVEDYHEVEL